MWPAALARLLRRRMLLILATILALIYLITSFLGNNGAFSSLHAEDYVLRRKYPVIWRTLQEQQILNDEQNNRTNNPAERCRNSEQGRELLVDERGYVCQRQHLLATGCCSIEVPETVYYSCETCNTTTHCCGIYEYCVSCCLHPSKRSLLELVLSTITGRQTIVYASVKDHFELCLVKCRTNSHSVEHENKYKDPIAKYCYGQTEAHESQREVLNSVTR